MLTYKQLGNNGRLGNQMFQYATLRGVGYKTNLSIKIPNGNYDLLKFNIKKDFIKPTDNTKHQYDEKNFHYCDDIFNVKDFTDLFGYFQSYKYFDFIKDELCKEFTINYNFDNLQKSLNSKNTISVHVRRGDYLKYPNIHPTCTIDYYKECINYFSKDSKFMIFSDDINWCKNNLNFSDNYYCEANNHIVELIMMSKCNHNIIANSSFSWWGAYLNDNDNKKVFYPKVWFGKQGPQDIQDLFPTEWSSV